MSDDSASRGRACDAPGVSPLSLHARRAGDHLGAPSGSARLVPLTRAQARVFVAAHHRHSDAPVGDVFRVGLELDGMLVGVAIAGRPAARLIDDGATLEITRVCVLDDVENGCSRLYGAACRAAAALGYRRVVTYTLASERASSVRAAGFVADREVEPRDSWARPKRPRHDLNLFGERTRDVGPKRRWTRDLTKRKEERWQ
jgi:hypothetical protein